MSSFSVDFHSQSLRYLLFWFILIEKCFNLKNKERLDYYVLDADEEDVTKYAEKVSNSENPKLLLFNVEENAKVQSRDLLVQAIKDKIDELGVRIQGEAQDVYAQELADKIKAVSNQANIDMANEEVDVTNALTETKSIIDGFNKLYTDRELTIEPVEAYKLAEELAKNPKKWEEIKVEANRLFRRFGEAEVHCHEIKLAEVLEIVQETESSEKAAELIDKYIKDLKDAIIAKIDKFINGSLNNYGYVIT